MLQSYDKKQLIPNKTAVFFEKSKQTVGFFWGGLGVLGVLGVVRVAGGNPQIAPSNF